MIPKDGNVRKIRRWEATPPQLRSHSGWRTRRRRPGPSESSLGEKCTSYPKILPSKICHFTTLPQTFLVVNGETDMKIGGIYCVIKYMAYSEEGHESQSNTHKILKLFKLCKHCFNNKMNIPYH